MFYCGQVYCGHATKEEADRHWKEYCEEGAKRIQWQEKKNLETLEMWSPSLAAKEREHQTLLTKVI
jgi:hypothetical protein